ncbi:MAG: hypothetical protein WDN75_14290 [Bacteroidota bacterium]
MKTFYAKTGRDATIYDLAAGAAFVNWGGDINKSYTTHQQDFGNKIGQGFDNTIMYVDFLASYMLKHNFFLDLKQTYRKSASDSNAYFASDSQVIMLALRWNIASRSYDF